MYPMQVDEFVRRLKLLMTEHNDARLAFFLGAGCSISSGIPAAGALVRQWLPRLKEIKTGAGDGLDAWVVAQFPGCDTDPAQHYGAVIEGLFRTPKERQREIERLTGGKDPGFGYATLAALMSHDRYGRHCNVVLTTNFDDMVSDALYLYTNKKPLVIAHESLAGFARAGDTQPLVVKLHGDARLAPRNTLAETDRLDEAVARAVTRLLQDSGLIFTGYGGSDRSIVRILDALPLDALPWGIYWVNSAEPGPDLRAWLEQRAAAWVQHLGFDELMVHLHDTCTLKPPDMSRYKTIEDTYRTTFQRLKGAIEHATEQPAAAAESAAAGLRSALDRVSTTVDWWQIAQDANKYEKTDPDRADQIYRDGIEKLPQSAELLNSYAVFLHVIRRQYDQAEAYFRKALEVDPDQVATLGSYAAFLFVRRRQDDQAEAYFRKALEIDPGNAFNLANYAAFLQERRKDYDQAEVYYQRALEAGPSLGTNVVNYAGFLLGRGRPAAARELLERTATPYLEDEDKLGLEFYRYAHLADERAAALGRLKQLLVARVSMPGADFSLNTDRAIQDGHPEPDLLRALARVITDEVPLDTLAAYPAWQSA